MTQKPQHTATPYPASYAAWERLLRPLCASLLKGKQPDPVTVDGWKFSAVRSYRSRTYNGHGPAWFADIRAEKDGCYPLEGSRDDIITAFMKMVKEGCTADTRAKHQAALALAKGE